METIIRLQKAIDFIEKHLKDDISVKNIAFNSYYSLYHFQRLFSVCVGMPVMEYVRKRRLSVAAYEMCEKDRCIIDLAYNYHFGYEQSFIRSFRREFNITPAHFKRTGEKITICKKISLLDSKKIKSDVSINAVASSLVYTLMHRKRLCGKKYHFYLNENKYNSILFRLKSEFISSYNNFLYKHSNSDTLPLYSIVKHISPEYTEGFFTLAVPLNSLKKVPDDFEYIDLPLHLNMNIHRSYNKSIHSLRYQDLDTLYDSLYALLIDHQNPYKCNCEIFSSYTIVDLCSLQNNQTSFNVSLPIVEK